MGNRLHCCSSKNCTSVNVLGCTGAHLFLGVIVYELAGSPIVERGNDVIDNEMDHIGRNRLIRQGDECLTTHHLRELEIPDELS